MSPVTSAPPLSQVKNLGGKPSGRWARVSSFFYDSWLSLAAFPQWFWKKFTVISSTFVAFYRTMTSTMKTKNRDERNTHIMLTPEEQKLAYDLLTYYQHIKPYRWPNRLSREHLFDINEHWKKEYPLTEHLLSLRTDFLMDYLLTGDLVKKIGQHQFILEALAHPTPLYYIDFSHVPFSTDEAVINRVQDFLVDLLNACPHILHIHFHQENEILKDNPALKPLLSRNQRLYTLEHILNTPKLVSRWNINALRSLQKKAYTSLLHVFKNTISELLNPLLDSFAVTETDKTTQLQFYFSPSEESLTTPDNVRRGILPFFSSVHSFYQRLFQKTQDTNNVLTLNETSVTEKYEPLPEEDMLEASNKPLDFYHPPQKEWEDAKPNTLLEKIKLQIEDAYHIRCWGKELDQCLNQSFTNPHAESIRFKMVYQGKVNFVEVDFNEEDEQKRLDAITTQLQNVNPIRRLKVLTNSEDKFKQLFQQLTIHSPEVTQNKQAIMDYIRTKTGVGRYVFKTKGRNDFPSCQDMPPHFMAGYVCYQPQGKSPQWFTFDRTATPSFVKLTLRIWHRWRLTFNKLTYVNNIAHLSEKQAERFAHYEESISLMSNDTLQRIVELWLKEAQQHIGQLNDWINMEPTRYSKTRQELIAGLAQTTLGVQKSEHLVNRWKDINKRADKAFQDSIRLVFDTKSDLTTTQNLALMVDALDRTVDQLEQKQRRKNTKISAPERRRTHPGAELQYSVKGKNPRLKKGFDKVTSEHRISSPFPKNYQLVLLSESEQTLLASPSSSRNIVKEVVEKLITNTLERNEEYDAASKNIAHS